MPTVRLRKRLLDRLVKGVSAAGEIGLALLMTAGVTHCGGSTQTGPGEGTTDGAADHQLAVEAAQEGGTVVEAAVEAAWSDAYPTVEAPAPPPDAGTDGPTVIVEAAWQPDGGDAGFPMYEAPTPAPDGG
jgi:hypothetical protein